MYLKKEVALVFALLILSQLAYSAVIDNSGNTLSDSSSFTVQIVVVRDLGQGALELENQRNGDLEVTYSGDTSTTISGVGNAAQNMDTLVSQGYANQVITGSGSNVLVDPMENRVYAVADDGNTVDLSGAAVTSKSDVDELTGDTITVVTAQSADGKIYDIIITSPPLGDSATTTVSLVERKPEESPPAGFNSISYPSYSQERIKYNFCGDSYLAFPEQCETPNTNNNPYCVHSITSQCVGTKTAARDALGRCNDACACQADSFPAAVCVKNSCGASCGSGADCPARYTCEQSTCSCVPVPCVEDWVCANYPATCPSSGIKTRTCADRNGCGTARNKPAESLQCTPQTTPICAEQWTCSEWNPSPCPSSGIQTRACTDAGKCGTLENKPIESRACTPTPITYCGDGAVQKPNSQGLIEECDGNLDQTISDNGFCKEIRKCTACKFETAADKYNAQPETCDGIDNDCNKAIDDYDANSCSN